MFANIFCWNLLFFLCLVNGVIQGQEKAVFRVVFYNVENLFDTRNDSLTADDDYTPLGRQRWNSDRYHQKLLHISQALQAVGEGHLPAIIGVAEVENKRVLLDLTLKTGLTEGDYGIVHADSPDSRGIDVALLYQKSVFQILKNEFFPVELKGKETTRDILYSKGVFAGCDTVHFFVCHFPSMRGGEAKSEWKRIQAASILKQKIDSIQGVYAEALIVVMGDLNGRGNTLAQRTLGTLDPSVSEISSLQLYNTGYYLLGRPEGSYRYRGEWQTLDHLIVSGGLLDGEHRLQSSRRMWIYAAEFLLEEDRATYGSRPKPTYRGPRYLGGYSDHLPVFIDLRK